MINEEWKAVNGYEGYYEVSSSGRVRSVNRTIVYKDGRIYNYKGSIMNPQIKRNGYLSLVLRKRNSNPKNYYVHRLVAEAFIANPNRYLTVNHKNENKRDNRADNLEWCSYKYNDNYGTRNERFVFTKEMKGKPFLCKETGKIYRSVTKAGRELGLSASSICKALRGKQTNVKGMHFIYI